MLWHPLFHSVLMYRSSLTQPAVSLSLQIYVLWVYPYLVSPNTQGANLAHFGKTDVLAAACLQTGRGQGTPREWRAVSWEANWKGCESHSGQKAKPDGSPWWEVERQSRETGPTSLYDVQEIEAMHGFVVLQRRPQAPLEAKSQSWVEARCVLLTQRLTTSKNGVEKFFISLCLPVKAGWVSGMDAFIRQDWMGDMECSGLCYRGHSRWSNGPSWP